jgi:hypothetical protein
MVLVVLDPLESPSFKPHMSLYLFFFNGLLKWVGLLGHKTPNGIDWPRVNNPNRWPRSENFKTQP